ncbi:MAG: type II toxin-antitoxin system prevent-host-death family antitoxin [Kiritimatiellae bacterium]|jgi:prevent-host-death family protein|nr:type II toxin-antitoxin system prevent-host-death family antitoxin [Kiritimatiellia bacterium]
MKNTYTITQAQQRFPAIVRETEELSVIPITRHQETVAYLVSKERMEAMAETLELLAQPEVMAQIHAFERGELQFHPLNALDGDEG